MTCAKRKQQIGFRVDLSMTFLSWVIRLDVFGDTCTLQTTEIRRYRDLLTF